jgi:hypothetical protein
VIIQGSGEVLPKDAVCFLDVPVNKTSKAFSKPVDRAVGEAIAAGRASSMDMPREELQGSPREGLRFLHLL